MTSKTEQKRIAVQRGGTSRDAMDPYAGHTPGPWTVEQDGNMNPSLSFRIVAAARDPSRTVTARQPYFALVDTEANAALIAAAPTLLRERDELQADLASEKAMRLDDNRQLAHQFDRREKAEARVEALESAAKSAAAELRHAYRTSTTVPLGTMGKGLALDKNLVERAIRILEAATTPGREDK